MDGMVGMHFIFLLCLWFVWEGVINVWRWDFGGRGCGYGTHKYTAMRMVGGDRYGVLGGR